MAIAAKTARMIQRLSAPSSIGGTLVDSAEASLA
jgi:hypothetical protein